MKENLKPCVYKLWKYPACVETRRQYDRVLFVERSGELRRLARLRTEGPEPEGNRFLIEQGRRQAAIPLNSGMKVSLRRPETG